MKSEGNTLNYVSNFGEMSTCWIKTIRYTGSSWLIDWFLRHVNPSRIILCLELKELCSLHVHIYIFYLVVSSEFLIFFFFACTRSYRIWLKFKQSYLIYKWVTNKYYHLMVLNGPENRGNERVQHIPEMSTV